MVLSPDGPFEKKISLKGMVETREHARVPKLMNDNAIPGDMAIS